MQRQTFSILVEGAPGNRSAFTVALVPAPGAEPVRIGASTAANDFAALTDAVALIRAERADNPDPVSLNLTVPRATADALNTRAVAAAPAWATLTALAPGNVVVRAPVPLG